MEKILAFGIEEAEKEKIKRAVSILKCKLIYVEKEDYRQLLKNLVEEKKSLLCEPFAGVSVTESLLYLSGFTDKGLDKVLAVLKKNEIRVTYKAIQTPANERWNVLQLLLEMEKERKALQK